MDTVIDTTRYMIAGYAVIIIVMAVYGLSLFLRARRLDQEEKELCKLIQRE